MQRHYDVIIMGAGISGLMLAKELFQAGLKVCLVDKSKIGGESSWAGGGIISPLYPWRYPRPVNLLAKWSQEIYPELMAELRPLLDPEYIQSGLLLLDAQETPFARDWADEFGYDLRVLSESQSREMFPTLEHSGDSLWMPELAQVRNPRLVKSLVRFLAAKVDIFEQLEGEIMVQADEVKGLNTPQGILQADAVALCAGAWTGDLIRGFAIPSEIKPVRGQMLLFRCQGLLSSVILKEHRYLIPRQDGHILCGSTLEDVGFDKTTTPEAGEKLREFACGLLPGLVDQPVLRHWSGLRPASPQGLPSIGKVPNIKGLFVNAGHFRNGVVLGPAAARLTADVILGRSCRLDPVWFSL